ncbi:phosphotransferase family protein [Nocardia goodfellowii]|uniref:Aminoglycoside phosphotransferase (APT) family kinase protein n=1 Tax=Nocardia goodfellowii TaxID=882446 RepID=A0ABS4QIX6_9NOCA|nr:phosphotransferase family protein [Nocardia goodfellowii]MBP2191659.1 aminoglycoside phosphotransferase (APT) family kinase protein [Nocardia goodfellowii]
MFTETTLLARDVTELLGRELPGPLTVLDLHRLMGGAGRETWSFDILDSGGVRHPLILRRDLGDGRTRNPDLLVGRKDTLDRAGEFALLGHLSAANVPVPRPVAAPPPGDVLDDCIVMARVDGEARPWVLVRSGALDDVRPRLVRQLGTALARVHSCTAADLPFVPQRPLAGQLDLIRDLLDRGGPPRPALEAGLRWCRDRLPTIGPRPMRLVHGDFRIGNYVVGPDGLRALLDWQSAHIGDPVTDLGFACMRCWRFGADDREFTGIGARADFLAAYQAAGGTRVDHRLLHFSEVLGTLVTAGVFLSRTAAFRSGADRTLETAATGRRIAELEYDLLALLDRDT